MVLSRLFALVSLGLVLLGGCSSPEAEVQGDTVLAASTSTPSESPVASPLLPNELRPFPGILAGGQPDEQQLKRIAEDGYRTVINLRMPDEEGVASEASKVEALGMGYFALPVEGRSGPTRDQAQRLSEILADENALPAVVHCAAGGRVGAIFALEAFWVDGESIEAALEIGRRAGMAYMEPTVQKIMNAEPPATAASAD